MPVKKPAAKPCGLCGFCDLARFRAWRERIEAGLGESTEEGRPRMELLHEIHDDVARRYPLGIAVVLGQVIANLACAEDDADKDAARDLEDLEEDEQRSGELNPDEVADAAKTCSVARAWKPRTA